MKVKSVTYATVDEQWLYAQVGKRMRKAREVAGMPQEEVGYALRMTRANVSNIEAGRSAIMLTHLYNLARLLRVSVMEFLPK